MNHRPESPATEAEPDSRSQPHMGSADADGIGELRFGTGTRPPSPLLQPRWLRPTLAGIAVAVLLLLLARKPLADWFWPDIRAQTLQQEAARALARGHLTAADGSGARERYEAALAIDPDRNNAREGLARVGLAALAQARTAIAAGRYGDAHRDLQLAQALQVPREQFDAVASLLRTREASHAGIDRLLTQAAQARSAHRLDGGVDAALPLYRQVLALEPERLEALEGREDALSDLLQDAMQALGRADIAQAAAQVTAARGYDAGHADLPNAQVQLEHGMDQMRQRAGRDLHRGRLQAAADGYQRLLQIDGDDSASRHGLDLVATGYAQRAQRLASDFRFADADAAMARARALAPGTAAVREALQHLTRAHRAQAGLPSPLSSRERQRRVHTLLADATAAEARGDLLAPPGDSAFDKLRAARALAPEDAAVRLASARLLPIARSCFDRELRGNNLARARACLDAWVAVAGGGAAVVQARRRLALRWLAVGDERLGAGGINGARAALASARSVDAQAPGLEAFERRLQTASAGD